MVITIRKPQNSPVLLDGAPGPARAERAGGGVQSVERALSLMDALGEERGEVGIAELSKRVGLHVSTAHRLLTTLVAKGYCRQSPETGRYALGGKLFRLGEASLGQMDLSRTARPFLARLCEETGETANLVVLDGRDALYLGKAESPQNLRIFSRIGHRAPLHCTAVGKILLAYRPPEARAALLGRGPLKALTRHTNTSRKGLLAELTRVRDQGYALDLEECEEGAACLAVPVLGAGGQIEAALSVSGPSVRMTPQRLAELAPLLCRAGQALSLQLGFGGRRPPRAAAAADPQF